MTKKEEIFELLKADPEADLKEISWVVGTSPKYVDNIRRMFRRGYSAGRKVSARREGLRIIHEGEEKEISQDFVKGVLAENKRLKGQVEILTKPKRFERSIIDDTLVRIGIVSDTHIGSTYADLDRLEMTFDWFKKEGIEEVYHPGDVIDGWKMYRGHEFELAPNGIGADAQTDLVADLWPNRGIKTKFITGNHDLSFHKQNGFDVGAAIVKKRSEKGLEDLQYLGQESIDILFETPKGTAIVKLVHPGKGSAYALSYHPQKMAESFSGGHKPHILIIGHYHKAEHIPGYRNIDIIQAGTLQKQTSFMIRQNLSAMVGAWILEFTVDQPNKVSRFRGEFMRFFD